MNAKQRKQLRADFIALMQQHKATPVTGNSYDEEHATHEIIWKGEPLRCHIIDDWFPCKWRTHDPMLLKAYLASKGGDSMDSETPESNAAYVDYQDDMNARRKRIVKKGLPFNNPFTFKWNFHSLEDLEAGLSSHKPEGK